MKQWPKPKDPDDKARYAADWTRFLAGQVIKASEWIVVDDGGGCTISEQDHNDTHATVRIEGGTHGRTLKVLNRITVDAEPLADEQFDSTFHLLIRTR